MAKNRARPVEEPSGYDYPPTDRIPVQDEVPDNRDTRGAGRPDHAAGNRVDEPMDRVGGRVDDGFDNSFDNGVDNRMDDRVGTGVDNRLDDRVGDRMDDRVDGPAGTRPADEVGTVPATPVGDPMVAAPTAQEPAGTATWQEHATGDKAPDFFDDAEVDGFRDRWRELQAGFVDDPAQAVRGADELVDEIMRELAERKKRLAGRWHDGQAGSADTEELRVVIREYRAFFDRLLNA